MKNEIRVLLADDHEVVRSGLARMLERNDDMHIVGEATSGEQAYQMYTKAKVIMFSMHENVTLAVQSMSAGAAAYLAKSGDSEDIVKAIRQVMDGKSYLSSEMAQRIALQSVSGSEDPIQRLTVREFEVFRLLAEGHALEYIAETLNLGQKTVANYQTMLKQKLGFHSSVELVRLAIKYNVIKSH